MNDETTMKKIITSIILISLSLVLSAQGQIHTKKMKIADATTKTLKVVLTGDMFFDESMKEEMMMRWHISPYEFCTLAEFESLKKNPAFYFLLKTKGQQKKEKTPGIEYLTMVKGTAEAADGVNKMLSVVDVPFCPADNSDGREIVFLPAFLDIIQKYVLASMESDMDGYGGLAAFASGLSRTGTLDFRFAHQDMSDELMDINFQEYNIIPTNDDESYDFMLNNTAGTIVSYCVAPAFPENGSVCYKMIIDCSSHKLYWFRKHKISNSKGAGFLYSDLLKIREERKY